MRHGKKFNHLGRKKGHRTSMLANMACSLIEHKRINTTLAKAKALKQFIEPIITKSKSDTTHNRRIVFSRIRQKAAVAELFRNVSAKIGDRPGGYTRIIKLGNRLGDNAEMAMVELVDYNDSYVPKKKKPSTRRSKRGSKKSDDQVKDQIEEVLTEEAPAEEAPAEEAPAEEAPVEEAPAEEAPAEEAPAEEAPAEEAPAEEAPAEEAPAEEAPAEEAPAEEKKDDKK
jgi:large subunit ribosomal protein L17